MVAPQMGHGISIRGTAFSLPVLSIILRFGAVPSTGRKLPGCGNSTGAGCPTFATSAG